MNYGWMTGSVPKGIFTVFHFWAVLITVSVFLRGKISTCFVITIVASTMALPANGVLC